MLGFIALAVCVACGIILGAILAFPVATSFSAAILLTQPREPKQKVTNTGTFPAVMPEAVEAETAI